MANLLGRMLRRGGDWITRYSVQDYIRQITNPGNIFGPGPMFYPPVTYSRGRPSERVENSFPGYVFGGYKSNPVIYGIMTRRSSVFSEIRFAWRKVEQGKPGDLFYSDELALLERPWPNGTTGELLTRMIQDVDLAGNFYAVREGDRIRRLRPDWVSIVLSGNPLTDADIDVVGYVFTPGGPDAGQGVAYLPDEVVHWSPVPDPEAQYRGMSWLTPVVREILGDHAATTHKLKFYERGAVLGPIFRLGPDVTPEQFKEFKDAADTAHTGVENAYAPVYIGGGADVTLATANMQQLEFTASQGKSETRMTVAGGVPAVIVGVSEGLQGSSLNAGNYNAAKRSFVDGTLRTLWRSACAALSTIIDVPDAAELWYDESCVAYLREDQQDAAQIMQIKFATMASAITAGFEPDSTVLSVAPELKDTLKHSGLTSVQLLPPGQNGEPDVNAEGQTPDTSGGYDSGSGDTTDPYGGDFGSVGRSQTSADDLTEDEFVTEDDLAEADEIIADEEADAIFADDEDEVGRAVPFNAELHPRGPGGKFRTVLDRVVGALAQWDQDGRHGDPLAHFTRPQLVSVAKTRHIEVPPRMPLPALKKAIHDDLIAAMGHHEGHPVLSATPHEPAHEPGLPEGVELHPMTAQGMAHASWRVTFNGEQIGTVHEESEGGTIVAVHPNGDYVRFGPGGPKTPEQAAAEMYREHFYRRGHLPPDEAKRIAAEAEATHARAAESAAVARQAEIDAKRRVSNAVAEALGHIDSGNTDAPNLRRLADKLSLAAYLTPQQNAALLAKADDLPAFKRAIAALERKHGLTRIGEHGKLAPYDSSLHKPIGGSIQSGHMVHTVQVSHEATLGSGEKVKLGRAVVEPATAAEVAAARKPAGKAKATSDSETAATPTAPGGAFDAADLAHQLVRLPDAEAIRRELETKATTVAQVRAVARILRIVEPGSTATTQLGGFKLPPASRRADAATLRAHIASTIVKKRPADWTPPPSDPWHSPAVTPPAPTSAKATVGEVPAGKSGPTPNAFITEKHIEELQALADRPGGTGKSSGQTGIGRQRDLRLDDLRRMGYARVSGGRYTITDSGRAFLAGEAPTPSAGATVGEVAGAGKGGAGKKTPGALDVESFLGDKGIEIQPGSAAARILDGADLSNPEDLRRRVAQLRQASAESTRLAEQHFGSKSLVREHSDDAMHLDDIANVLSKKANEPASTKTVVAPKVAQPPAAKPKASPRPTKPTAAAIQLAHDLTGPTRYQGDEKNWEGVLKRKPEGQLKGAAQALGVDVTGLDREGMAAKLAGRGHQVLPEYQGKTGPDIAGIADKVTNLPDAATITSSLAGLKPPDLRKIATELNLPIPAKPDGGGTWTAANLAQYIAENILRDRSRWSLR